MGKAIKILRRTLCFVLSLALVIGLAPSGKMKLVEAADRYVSVVATVQYDKAFEVLDYVNKERRKYGLNELTMDVDLMEAAIQRAAESCVVGEAFDHSEITDAIAHTRPDGDECFTVNPKSMGENIAYGISTSYAVMYGKSDNIDPNNEEDMDHSSWMRSSGHRDNILYGLKEKDKSHPWKSVGIGVVYYNGTYKYYWAQEFSTATASEATRRTDNQTRTFSVGVTQAIYNRLVSRGKLSSDSGSGNVGDGGSGGSGSGGSGSGGGTKTITGKWMQSGGRWWFKTGDTTYLKNAWLKSDGKWYAFGSDGYMMTGWHNIGGTYYYFSPGGAMAENEWIDGYWLSGGGAWTYKSYGSWRHDSTGWWFGDESGWYAHSQWQKIDGYWYYFNAAGYMVSNQYIDGYWLGPDGAMQ